MKRLAALTLLSAVLSAGPASAMRAHDYLDADRRGPVTLPERPLADITLPAEPAIPAAEDAAQLPPPGQPANAAATPQVTSAVPEPSALAMLACGLLLLLFAPYGRNDEAIVPEPIQRPDSTL
ncbi:PEP-CTERM protein-sorting domain-containing protein [Duganella sp. CF402]|uniref:hypothetical protein n=1 Tax=unclassified Duganella TaxID=2636909 RepID=UPI0008BA1936|nr:MULTISPECIES: hypothetical protein [unclassified Duganella]RZT06112.1 putative secreted protein with PEP-CTERM sorting signal [Duganella sp. BK701]SEM75549.1 PEP-CTERM protein-sorting domain-containing protein [Duganella sp. CF402]